MRFHLKNSQSKIDKRIEYSSTLKQSYYRRYFRFFSYL